MKRTKKIVSLLLVMVMLLGMSVTSFAMEGSSGISSASTNDRSSIKDLNISIMNNPHLFNAPSGSELMWSNDNIDYDAKAVNIYRVVSAYRLKENNDVWFIEMNSNIKGTTHTGTNYKVSKFGWTIKQEGADSVLQWAPSGTTIITTGGQTINATISPSYGGVSVGSVGTSFIVNQKSDEVEGMNMGSFYDLEWRTNKPVSYTQDLNAAISYYVPNHTVWTWNSRWTYNW